LISFYEISCLLQTAPGTGELVVFGVDAIKPYLEVGVVSGMYSFSLHLTHEKKKVFTKTGSNFLITCVTIDLANSIFS
jgi:hypothetical protein